MAVAAGVVQQQPGASRSDVGGRIVLGSPKSHQSRTVPIPRFLARELAQAVPSKEPDLLFTMPGGSMLRLPNWRRAVFLSARSRVGISPRFRLHDLRHTAASLMIQGSTPPASTPNAASTTTSASSKPSATKSPPSPPPNPATPRTRPRRELPRAANPPIFG